MNAEKTLEKDTGKAVKPRRKPKKADPDKPKKPARRFGRTKRERGDILRTMPFMIPSICGVLLFFILPFFVVIY